MSTIAMDRGPSQHPKPAVLQHNIIDSSTKARPSVDMTPTSSSQEDSMEDIIGSSVEPSTSRDDRDPKKKEKGGFNLKKTAKNVYSGITRRKKGLEEERSRSHEELRAVGDQAKGKSTPFNKMLNFSNPNNKITKMWSSFNKTFSTSSTSSTTPPPFNELGSTRSTMTLGRFFGRKKEQDLPPLREGQKSHTLGRMFNFKQNRKSRDPADSEAKP